MMFKPLQLVVLTPAEILLDVAGVHWVHAQLADGGGIGIWPGHAPLLAETVAAPLRYADDLGEHSLLLEAGILQITPGQVTVYSTGLASSDAAAGRSSENGEEKRGARLAEALYGQEIQTPNQSGAI